MKQLFDYDCFEDGGIHGEAPNPEGYKKIRGRLCLYLKHDGRHKARYATRGHLTDIPVDSVYSGVISLRGLCIVTFLAEINGLDLCATNVQNAYLEALTGEKIYIVTSPKFKELEGHILIIRQALYSLRTSGLRWHEKFADCLCGLGFEPSQAEPDIWMRRLDDHYEYVAVYVDDLAITSKDLKSITDALTNCHGFKLKGTGPISSRHDFLLK